MEMEMKMKIIVNLSHLMSVLILANINTERA